MFVGILGPVEAQTTAGRIQLGPRQRTLLALLAIRAGEVVPTGLLIDELYGETPPSDAANALQGQVSRLRRALGSPELIEFHPAGYRLNLDKDQVDAHRFTRLVAQEQPGEALKLWRGSALADVPLPGHATRLEQAKLEALEVHIAHQLQRQQADPREIQQLVEEHPLNERLRGHLMQALQQHGRQAEALQAFEDAKNTLADELGVDPSDELKALHLRILRQESPKNLPAQLTSFVGRAAELQRIARLLETQRLITLTGPGGAGKTRLAVEAAQNDAVFVDLAPTKDVATAILNALNLKETVLQPEERLTLALQERDTLLILDNCEHVVDQAARTAQTLLQACDKLRILATSREALGITGETLCQVPPLDIDDVKQLFADRARATNPSFRHDEHTEEICRKLDGLPLAIELAAARTRTLSTKEISDRLQDRFRLLTKGSRTSVPRHQTLSAVVEWSWDLLTDEEKDLASTLATFNGGADIQALEAQNEDALDLIAALTDKSLVESQDGRYRMLDTIREFCRPHAPKDREHAEYFGRLAAQADPELRQRNQLHWFAKLSADHANLVQALEWTTEHDPGAALHLLKDLSWYWYLKGSRHEIQATAQKLLDKTVEDDSEEYVILLAHAAPERVKPALHQLTRVEQPFVFIAWAMLAGPPDPDSPHTRLQEQIEQSTDPWIQGLIGFSGAYVTWMIDGNRAEATAKAREALTRFQGLGERWGTAQVLDALASMTEDPLEALQLTDQALKIVEELGANEERAELMARRADRLENDEEAEADYRKALELATKAGLTATRALAHAGLAEIALRRNNFDQAQQLLTKAEQETGFGWMHSTARERVEEVLIELESRRAARSPKRT